MRFGVTLIALCVLAHVGLATKCATKAPVPTDNLPASPDPPSETTSTPPAVENPASPEDPASPDDNNTEDPANPGENDPGNDTNLDDPASPPEEDKQESTTPDVLKVTADQLDKGVPKGKGEGQCGASDAEGCVPNSKAVDPINKAIAKYKITRRGEIVAVLALMAFESDSWKYNINISKHQPGQGTMAMMMYPSIYPYAKYLYPNKVKDEWAKLDAETESDPDSSKMNEVRALVLGDDDSFGAGFWFLTNRVEGDYHNNEKKLRDGNFEDFKTYCTEGVQAGWDDGRKTVWDSINSALK
ncbi:hypothetical protein COEREDRAFT_83397 [Coemansia reversa NRRL 1564]|uniref:Uncharacterized protein n=1 Tax=Coemansia reversa (strain ATCC 12441 / NRRL 1564) TaxID=763665 RepID=A0A2G5B3H5_COERN|nr:hypothetical protein COEREDRAFT_83397 [Coemansia reversa NRRL 1564]|eukprot:PIA13569.1 hypothetical protein COEREDRAFT_83397 [Coemansia reversa NRRL 1564]